MIRWWRWLSILALVLAAGANVHVARAATWVVTNTDDSGSGSLRQVLSEAASGDVIIFDLTYPATITLSAELTINQSVTIAGAGAWQLTVSGNDAGRVFNITTGTVALSGLTIAHGYTTNYGGGVRIASGASVTIDRCTIRDNRAGVDGGGIHNAGILTVTNSTIADNSLINATGAGGGALASNTAGSGTIALEHATIYFGA